MKKVTTTFGEILAKLVTLVFVGGVLSFIFFYVATELNLNAFFVFIIGVALLIMYEIIVSKALNPQNIATHTATTRLICFVLIGNILFYAYRLNGDWRVVLILFIGFMLLGVIRARTRGWSDKM